MKTNQMTKIAEWVMDFDGLASKIGMSGYQMDEMRELFRQILVQQREEILDQVGKEMNKWWKDEGYWTCGANEAVEGVLEILSDKLSALRLSIKKKV